MEKLDAFECLNILLIAIGGGTSLFMVILLMGALKEILTRKRTKPKS